MRFADVAIFAWRSLSSYRLRTLLMLAAMSLGVGAVVVLTSLGEGARRYVRNKFSSLGSNLIAVFPGRAETAGGVPGALVGRTPRDLTLDDAIALERIRAVRPISAPGTPPAVSARPGRTAMRLVPSEVNWLRT